MIDSNKFNIHEFFMNLALEQARMAEKNLDVPIGAVIVKDGSVIACGYNTREFNNSAIGHAEIVAIDLACKKLKTWRLVDCDIYVTVEPCMMCAGAIISARLKNLYFGCKDTKTGAFGSIIHTNLLNLNHKISVCSGILERECQQIIQDFFKELRLKK